MIAFVTSVVPCTIPQTSPIGMPFASSVSARIVSIARAGSCGVVSVLPTATSPCSPTTQRSVNVPPMSTPTAQLAQASFPTFGYWSRPNISICGGRCWKSTPPSTYSFDPVM